MILPKNTDQQQSAKANGITKAISNTS